MNLLLDTHCFIWWANETERLSPTALAALSTSENQLFLSVASAWEMQIKLHIGKLRLRSSLAQLIESQRQINGLQVLPIALPHVFALAYLPDHHRDPFDRLLIAQANYENLTIRTTDSAIAAYNVPTLW